MTPSPHLRFVLALSTCLAVGLAACSKDKPQDSAAGEMTPDANMEYLEIPSEYDPSKFVPDGTKSADGQVTKDFAKQTLPTDVYLDLDYSVVSNANQLYLHHCLKEKGVDSPKPQPDPPFKHQPKPNENPVTGEYIFNEQTAARDGYRGYSLEAMSGDSGPVIPDDPFDTFLAKYMGWDKEEGVSGGTTDGESEQLTPEQKNFEDCNKKFNQEFKRPGVDYSKDEGPTLDEQKKDPQHFAGAFTWVDTPFIQEKAKVWKACMQELGIPDLPDTPYMMPPESKDKIWHPENHYDYNDQGQPIDEAGNVIPEEATLAESEITEEEKAIATKDAECRTSSGWDRAVYDTRWGLITDYLKENEAGIKSYMNDKKAYMEKLQSYLQNN